MKLNVTNETSKLKAVVLGRADSNGPIPKIEDCYDPKSRLHVAAGTYPLEKDMVVEMEAVNQVFQKHQVQVFRPEIIEDYNQIFSRDIACVIDDKIIISNILPDRDQEIQAIQHVLDQIDDSKILRLPEEAHLEGGDIMPYGEYIFVGTYYGEDYPDYITARTNQHAVAFLKENFPNKTVKTFNLRKSNTDPKENALHLDCCFQPVGKNHAILHKNGFLEEKEFEWLLNFFGTENVFEITKQEMYDMNSNIFSISENVVISEQNFSRLNAWLESLGIQVEKVPYAEIAKQEGLLRCSTLPLIRE